MLKALFRVKPVAPAGHIDAGEPFEGSLDGESSLKRTLTAKHLVLLGDPANPLLRERLEGHLTGGAWLVSADGRRTLLTHHRKLGRWLQLGGHADGDEDMARVALKEAGEESGLSDLSVEGGIFDLDRHWIPERKDVPGHWHYDIRYVVRANGGEDYVVSEESLDLAWRDIGPIAAEPDESLSRMARKWLARNTA